MKIYTGVDIVSNIRIKGAYEKFGEKFLKRVYTERELEYCFNKKDFTGCFAARFAAKEAFIKAFYKFSGQKPSFREIEILGSHGSPAKIRLHSEVFNLSNCQIDVSISHEKDYSVAFVVLCVF